MKSCTSFLLFLFIFACAPHRVIGFWESSDTAAQAAKTTGSQSEVGVLNASLEHCKPVPLAEVPLCAGEMGSLQKENVRLQALTRDLERVISSQQAIIDSMVVSLRALEPAVAALKGSSENVMQNTSDTVSEEAAAASVDDTSESIFMDWSTMLFLLGVVAIFARLSRSLSSEYAIFKGLKGNDGLSQDEHQKYRGWQSFFAYRMDLWIAATPRWREIILGLFTLFLIVFGGVTYKLATGLAFGRALWKSWVFVVDSGAHSDEEEVMDRVVALVLTIGGMIGFALMVSILTDGLREHMETIRLGRSAIVCHGHSLILGWTDKTIPLIEELAEANSSEGGGIIVILCEVTRGEVEEEISVRIGQRGLKGSTVVVRSGSAMLPADLKMVSAHTSRAIILLSDTSLSTVQADDKSLRTVLCLRTLQCTSESGDEKSSYAAALKNALTPKQLWTSNDLNYYSYAFKRRNSHGSCSLSLLNGSHCQPIEDRSNPGLSGSQEDEDDNDEEDQQPEGPHIIVELTDVDNVPLVRIVGGDAVETLVTHDITGRLIIQAARQQGMARVLEKLIGFEGCEFYIERWPELVGKCYKDVAFSFADAVPIGVFPSEGRHKLNPDDDYIMQKGDRIIVIAEDNDTYHPEPKPLYTYDSGAHGPRSKETHIPERILICGWRRDFGDFIEEFDQNVAPGTEFALMNHVKMEDREGRFSENNRCGYKNLQNATLVHYVGDQTLRRDLEKLPLEMYDSCIIVPDEDFEDEAIAADGRTISTMLLIRDIRRSRPLHVPNFTLTSEVLDPRTRHLVHMSDLSEYVMSNQLIASAIAMVAEARECIAVIREVLTSDGCEIYLRNCVMYMRPGEHLSFWQVSGRCRDSSEVLIGYMEGPAGEIHINPAEKDEVITWKGDEILIVLAED